MVLCIRFLYLWAVCNLEIATCVDICFNWIAEHIIWGIMTVAGLYTSAYNLRYVPSIIRCVCLQAKNAWKSKWVQFGIHENIQNYTEPRWWGKRHHMGGPIHDTSSQKPLLVQGWQQCSWVVGWESVLVSATRNGNTHAQQDVLLHLWQQLEFLAVVLKAKSPCCLIWKKQVANGHLQGKSMKLVTIDDAQRGKKLLNQWSESKRLRLMVLI